MGALRLLGRRPLVVERGGALILHRERARLVVEPHLAVARLECHRIKAYLHGTAEHASRGAAIVKHDGGLGDVERPSGLLHLVSPLVSQVYLMCDASTSHSSRTRPPRAGLLYLRV